MPNELPYLNSYKNVGKLFEKINSAKIPDAVTTKYLYDVLGLKSITDRPLIPFMKTLGFIDASGKPTGEYSLLKNPKQAGLSIGRAIKRAYTPLFDANENAHKISTEELRGLIAQVAGTDTSVTAKILGTFNSLVKLGKFDNDEENIENDHTEGKEIQEEVEPSKGTLVKPQFHYNIQIHLPSNASEETYLNIFNALRRTFE